LSKADESYSRFGDPGFQLAVSAIVEIKQNIRPSSTLSSEATRNCLRFQIIAPQKGRFINRMKEAD
jgi:hypothetical protein